MNKKINWRHWHAWLSIVLAIPLFLSGISAVLIAHHQALGLKNMPINGDWLPGHSFQAAAAPEIRASLPAGDGRQYLGTKSGLLVLLDKRLQPVEPLTGWEVRSLSVHGGMLIAAGAKGAWLLKDGAWRQIYRQPVHQAHIAAHKTFFLATLDQGLQVSRDLGSSWQPDRDIAAALQSLPSSAAREDYSFNKLVMDVHTGKAFLGKRWEWLWIDSLGFMLVFLALTGVYLWWQGQKRQV